MYPQLSSTNNLSELLPCFILNLKVVEAVLAQNNADLVCLMAKYADLHEYIYFEC